MRSLINGQHFACSKANRLSFIPFWRFALLSVKKLKWINTYSADTFFIRIKKRPLFLFDYLLSARRRARQEQNRKKKEEENIVVTHYDGSVSHFSPSINVCILVENYSHICFPISISIRHSPFSFYHLKNRKITLSWRFLSWNLLSRRRRERIRSIIGRNILSWNIYFFKKKKKKKERRRKNSKSINRLKLFVIEDLNLFVDLSKRRGKKKETPNSTNYRKSLLHSRYEIARFEIWKFNL